MGSNLSTEDKNRLFSLLMATSSLDLALSYLSREPEPDVLIKLVEAHEMLRQRIQALREV